MTTEKTNTRKLLSECWVKEFINNIWLTSIKSMPFKHGEGVEKTGKTNNKKKQLRLRTHATAIKYAMLVIYTLQVRKGWSNQKLEMQIDLKDRK